MASIVHSDFVFKTCKQESKPMIARFSKYVLFSLLILALIPLTSCLPESKSDNLLLVEKNILFPKNISR
jgi:hypothetical protein